MPIFRLVIAPATSERAKFGNVSFASGVRTSIGRPASSPTTGSPENSGRFTTPPQSLSPERADVNSAV